MKVDWCKWTGAVYPDRFCQKQATPGDDLCVQHRGHVDALVRIFCHWYEGMTAK